MKTTSFWLTAFWIIIVSLVLNILLYYFGSVTGIMRKDLVVPEGAQQITLVPVILATLIGVVGALIVYAIVTRIMGKSFSFFIIVALIVLILSFGLPFLLPMPLSMNIYLNLMHVVVAVTVIYFLYRHRKAKKEKQLSKSKQDS